MEKLTIDEFYTRYSVNWNTSYGGCYIFGGYGFHGEYRYYTCGHMFETLKAAQEYITKSQITSM